MARTEIAVVGGGPAGLSAAIQAARAGARVTVLDENKQPGGQLFKQIHKFFGSEEHWAGTRGFRIGQQLLDECLAAGVEYMLDTVVYGIYNVHTLGLARKDRTSLLEADKVILCTGAIENALVFSGWTKPGVMTAGAVQTMINIQRVLPGRRFLMVGSGNVGLIVSYQLLQAGAQVVAVIDAAPDVGGYQVHAAKIRRAGVPIYTRHTILEALGDKSVTGAVIAEVDEKWAVRASTERRLDLDVICLAVGLSPQLDLARMCGCEYTYQSALGGFVPIHDQNMETTVPGVYVAGDIAGVEEASIAIEEGRLAGIAAAESLGYLVPKEAEARKAEARRELMLLRHGPFGCKRQAAKESLMHGTCSGRKDHEHVG